MTGIWVSFVANTTSRSSPSNGSQTTTPTSGATPPTSQATVPTPPTSQTTAPTPSAILPSGQATTLASSPVPPGINPSTPPRLNTILPALVE